MKKTTGNGSLSVKLKILCADVIEEVVGVWFLAMS